ncbi:YiiD C-terminal domain-containing protein [Deltaproteobacteria bacterium TL4]
MSKLTEQVLEKLETSVLALFENSENEKENPVRGVLKRSTLSLLSKGIGLAIPFVARSGLDIVEVNSNMVRCKMPFKLNKNHVNIMYAGALFTLAEAPGGVVSLFSFGTKYIPIVKEMSITFIQAAKTDVFVESPLIAPEEVKRIKATVSQNGKCDFELESVLKNVEGEIVARSKGIYQIRPR